MHNGYRVFRSCNEKASYKLHGMRNTIIYVTYMAYLKMSYKFEQECKIRNIEVRILT